MKMIEAIKGSVKVLPGSTLAPSGKEEWTGFLSADGYTRMHCPLPGDTQLDLNAVESIDHVTLEEGWRSPKELAKVGGVTFASLLGTGLIMELLLEGASEAEAAATALRAAIATNDAEAAAAAVEALVKAQEVAPAEEIAAGLVGLTGLIAPAIYGTLTLSARKIRMVITLTEAEKFLKLEIPEYLGSFLLGLYRAPGLVTKPDPNGNGAGAAANGAANGTPETEPAPVASEDA